MLKIPAGERFNHHEKSLAIAPELLREALAKFGMYPAGVELERLSGGFMNANFLARGEGKKVVFRVYASGASIAQKEFHLLRFLESQKVLTPHVHSYFEIQDRPIVVMEYLDGVSLQELLVQRAPVDPEIYTEIGRQLALIHNIRFERAGFIGPHMRLQTEFDNFTAFIRVFIERTLLALESRPDKLDLKTNHRFRKLIEDKWDIAVRTEAYPQLTHCDFNPKNILVSKDPSTKLLGIIDWEFSDSANGLIDFGNFFRFAYDYPEGAREKFISGYKEHHDLPPDWEVAARLLDLGSMCGFLERKEDYQKSFFTARTVIQSTLEHFGY